MAIEILDLPPNNSRFNSMVTLPEATGPNHPVLVAESPWNIMKSNRPIRRPIRLFMIQLLPADGFCGTSHGEMENPPGRPLESSKKDGLASKR